MSITVKPNVVSIASALRPERSGPTQASAASALSPVGSEEVSVHAAEAVARSNLAAAGRVHEAVSTLHAAEAALSSVRQPNAEGAGVSLPFPPELRHAYSHLEQVAEVLRSARTKVLDLGPIPNREAAEVIAKLVAENAEKSEVAFEAMAGKLAPRLLELAS